MYIVFLIGGFVLLIWGADHFVSGASTLARKLGIPSLIVGLTVVAFGTSAPELAVSLSASFAGSNAIAVGNVIGSNLFNTLLVIGFSAIICPLVCDKTLVNRDMVAVILASMAMLIMIAFDGIISRIDGLILLAGLAIVMYLQISSGVKSNKASKALQSEKEKDNSNALVMILNILLGLVAIVIGGELAVDGASDLARIFGLSETIIGLTVVAVGTSLPELVTSVIATKKGENEIAIGNVVGSNLFNILLILGTACIIKPITVEPTAVYDVMLVLAISITLFICAKKEKLGKPLGISFIVCYFVYMTWVVIR